MPSFSYILHPEQQLAMLDRRFGDRYRGSACIVLAGGPSVGSISTELLDGNCLIATNLVITHPRFRALAPCFCAGFVLDWTLLKDLIPFIINNVKYPIFTGNSVFDNDALLHVMNSINVFRIPSNYTRGLGDSFFRFSNGGNSGFSAIQLAILLGFRDIGLLGFDGSIPGKLRFHSDYPPGMGRSESLTRHALSKWSRDLDHLAPVFKERGIKISNLSTCSSISAFPFVSLEEWNKSRGQDSKLPTKSRIHRNEHTGAVRNHPSDEFRFYPDSGGCYSGAYNSDTDIDAG